MLLRVRDAEEWPMGEAAFGTEGAEPCILPNGWEGSITMKTLLKDFQSARPPYDMKYAYQRLVLILS